MDLAENQRLANFVICGTEKAGTTSIFTYLSEHPDVCGSNVKETNFFRDHFVGNSSVDTSRYSSYFDRYAGEKILMEASPGYLAGGADVARRMHSTVPNAKLLFVLRDPIYRLYSSFNFHAGKLNLPADLTFEEYIKKCLKYSDGGRGAEELGIGEWYLKAAEHGKYSDYLGEFLSLFDKENIKIMFFEDFNSNPSVFMRELCEFLSLDDEFFKTYGFKKINATFSGKVRWLHKLAVLANEKSERFLRQRPNLKQALVSTYKKLNQAREGYDDMSSDARSSLVAYYQPSIDSLRQYIGNSRIPWQ